MKFKSGYYYTNLKNTLKENESQKKSHILQPQPFFSIPYHRPIELLGFDKIPSKVKWKEEN